MGEPMTSKAIALTTVSRPIIPSTVPVDKVKGVIQRLLCAVDRHQQTIEHPDEARKAADLGVVFGFGQCAPFILEHAPEVGGDEQVDDDGDEVVAPGLGTADDGARICKGWKQ
jgi:hypothetical protein